MVVLALIPLRHFVLPKSFTPYEHSVLDAPTANSVAVLVSIGGPLEDSEGENVNHSRSRDEEMGGKTTARLIESEAGEKDREEGLRRREAKEEAIREEGVEGGADDLQRTTDVRR